MTMNHSDDDIFGRNIDQLDRETPRYNLSEEEDNNQESTDKNNHDQKIEKKISVLSPKPPSIASVQPYGRPSAQTMNPASPHPVKKLLTPNELPPAPASSGQYYNQRYPPVVSKNYHVSNAPTFQLMARQPNESANQILPQGISRPADPNPQKRPQKLNHPRQMLADSTCLMRPPFIPPQLNPALIMRPSLPEQRTPCYCLDCMHTPPVLSQQVIINSERQRIEDEILLRQRELDSCWQEDELDCPRDFTAIDRKKERFYAERADVSMYQRAEADVVQKDLLLGNREIKTSAIATSAYPTVVSRSHQSSSAPPGAPSYGGPIIKTKAQAVVSPLPRSIPPKKVNINTVVSQYSYNEDDTPQDFTSSSTWPQLEMGSRIPSSERINLSPLCMSGIPSGVQTPIEYENGQKPLKAQEPSSIKITSDIADVPSTTQLQQLPGHENKKMNLFDRFKGNEQYKNIHLQPQHPTADSMKDYTGSRWPQSEMGSRIPSSERISLSPLTMSGVQSAVQSGIQTPVEPNTGVIPVNKSDVISQNVHPVEKKNEIDKEVDHHHNDHDNVRDFSRIPQSEMGSQNSSSERIYLSPLCQSRIPSGCQTPLEVEDEEEANVKKDGVKLRHKKTKPASDNNNLVEIMSCMNIGESMSGIPRFNYVEEDSVKDYGRPEKSSRMQSYESLNFTPPWSCNTSGIVTPHDHSSLYGGSKPLHSQPLLEENEEESFNSNQSDQENLKKSVEFHDEQLTLDEKRAIHDETGRQQKQSNVLKPDIRVSNSQPLLTSDSDFSSGDQKQRILEQKQQKNVVDNTKRLEEYAPSVEHKQQMNKPALSAAGKRRNSWSSAGSTSSNRTDISTVVNAPTSMHNTAPGSPDPDGSEASDSVISDHEQDDNDTELPASFSQTGSPGPLHNNRNNVMPMQRQYQQQMWPAHADYRMPKKFHGNQNVECDGNQEEAIHSPCDDRMKHLINIPSNQSQNKEMPPANDSMLSNHLHQRYVQPQQQQQHGHYPNNHYYQQPLEHHGQTYYNNNPSSHEYMSRYHQHQDHPQGYFNYQQHSTHPNHMVTRSNMADSQRQYTGVPIHSSQLKSHPRQCMQAIPESQPSAVVHRHGPHGQPAADIHLNESQASPIVHRHHIPPDPHQESSNNHMYRAGYPPYPRAPAQQSNHQMQQQYYDDATQHKSHHPQQQQQQQQHRELQAPEKQYTQSYQHSRYSLTNLEPNHASPPHSETLDTVSVVSFASMAASHQNLDTKADMMSSLLSMLGTHDPDDMARTLLAMSSSPDSCAAMRQSGCMPLLIKLLHHQECEAEGVNWGARQRAGLALHNIVHSNSGDRRGKREIRVLRLLEIIRTHSEAILSKSDSRYRSSRAAPPLRDHGPGPAVAAIMKLSFEEDHKNTICELGGLQTIGEILAVDYMANNQCNDPYAIALRKYAGMVLINLTYNDTKNKSVLCSMHDTLRAIIGQLQLTDEEDLIQVFAGIVRNISWRPDDNTQRALRIINAVGALMICIQNLRTELCMCTVLSAVWNLSAHNSENKGEICRTPGSLKFLSFALSYRSHSKSFVVAENAGGILRNISSHIAVNMEYRRILRQEGCLQTLVTQLRSPSTRVVSNACGVLWNLSARCIADQELLWELGVVAVLKTLVHSKHKSISASSAAALRNLLAVKPGSSGTDTESHVSFQHRTNSVPMRTQVNRTDKKYRSVGPASKKHNDSELKSKSHKNDRGPVETNTHYSDLYQDPPVRGKIHQGDHDPPTYTEATGSVPDATRTFISHKRQDSASSDQQSNQVFFPADCGHIPLSNRIHKKYESSSSCSSYSPNDNKASWLPRKNIPPEPSKNEIGMTEQKTEKENITKKEAIEEQVRLDEDKSFDVEMTTYDDCKLTVVKDAIMIYKGTPKLTSSKKEKKQKQSTPKLSSKNKRNALKKSVDTLSSKDSDKSDVEKIGEKHDESKKENIWIKTKELKQRLLNKSHSSDLAFDKNLVNTSKKSHFELYSMSNFPDRVASDQCISMTDRFFRDDLMNAHSDMHHGSWSSCDISHCKDEKIFPYNQSTGFTPQMKTKRGNHLPYNGGTIPEQPYPITNDLYYQSQRNNVYSSNQQIHSKQTIDSSSENDKRKTKKNTILKNPLKKSKKVDKQKK